MLITFNKTGSSDPTKEYELSLGGVVRTGIYWPPQRIVDFKNGLNTTENGLDVETEAFAEITEAVCKEFSALAFDKGRTRLEIVVALTIARHAAVTK